jgi:hypothetical protein
LKRSIKYSVSQLKKNNVVMVRLDRTIQKPLQRLEKRPFIHRLEPILDPPVRPEDDETKMISTEQFSIRSSLIRI